MVEAKATDSKLSTDGTRARGRPATIALWVVTVAIAFLLFMAGFSKLTGPAGWGMRFADWGLPAALAPVIGVIEVAGAILILVPRFAPYAGAALAAVMLGAVGTHLANGEVPRSLVPLLFGVVAAAIAVARRN